MSTNDVFVTITLDRAGNIINVVTPDGPAKKVSLPIAAKQVTRLDSMQFLTVENSPGTCYIYHFGQWWCFPC